MFVLELNKISALLATVILALRIAVKLSKLVSSLLEGFVAKEIFRNFNNTPSAFRLSKYSPAKILPILQI